MVNNFRKYKEGKEIFYDPNDAVETEFDILPAGIYEVNHKGGFFSRPVTFFIPNSLKDPLVSFRGGVFREVMRITKEFFSPDSIKGYETLKLSHKMGIMMYGPPGTGKTSLAYLCMQALVDQYGAICLNASNNSIGWIQKYIADLREVQQNPVVLFVDEAERSLTSGEQEWLTFLDGHKSHTNLIFIGCTNYLDKIPKRITHRKSRIKHLLEVSGLPDNVYRSYIKEKIPTIDDGELSKFAFQAMEANLTIDELKAAVIDYVIDSMTVEDAISSARKYSEIVADDEKKKEEDL